jgi:hypothetical protein
LQAQSQTFGVEPDSVLLVNPTMEEYDEHTILLPNLTSDSLVLHWRLAEDNMLEGWDYFLCDLGECYSAIPLNATMDTAFAEDHPFMQITFNPNTIIGTGNLIFYVNDVAYPDFKQRIEFVFNAGISSASEIDIRELRVFPNPTQGIIQLKPNDWSVQSLEFYDILGKLKYRVQNPVFPLQISTHLYPGEYFMRINTPEFTSSQKIILTY